MNKVSRAKWWLAPAMVIAVSSAWSEQLSTTLSVNATGIGYKDSRIRDKGHEYGIDFGTSVGDLGFRAVYGKSVVSYFAIPTLDQDNYFVSGSYQFNLGSMPGKFTGGLNLHYVDNNDATRSTDSVKVIAPNIAYLNSNGTLRLDLGYARSNYQLGLHVDQWTPTVAFGLNNGSEWVQMRGYFIKVSDSSRAQGKSSTSALDMTWTHYFEKGHMLKPSNIALGALVGERVYTVNGDAGSVGNLADIQKGGYSLATSWNLPAGWSLSGMLGEQKFQESFIGTPNNYKMRFAFINVSKQW